jgi:surface polysaccharide O-acyltransferase-like enzyme
MTKQIWVTNLRVLATLAVITLHAASGGMLSFKTISVSSFWICNFFNTFGMFAVPCFVMLSGYLLLGRYDGNLQDFLQRRLTRVWIPFTVWVAIYLAYSYLVEHTHYSWQSIIQYYLAGNAKLFGHLWFVYMIVGLYLLTPFLSKWLKQSTQAELYLLLLLCFLSASIFPLFSKFSHYKIAFDLQNFGGCLGYYVAGYALGNANTEKYKTWYPLLFVLLLGFTSYGNYKQVSITQHFSGDFLNYLSPNIILYSISLLLTFKHFANIEIQPKLMNLLDIQSYGMYLAHLLILRYLSRKHHINWSFHHPLLGILLHAGLTIIISFCLIFLLRKLPKSHWITG